MLNSAVSNELLGRKAAAKSRIAWLDEENRLI